MERILERCCALDVHRNQVTACVHVPDQAGERSELRAQFSTMTAELLALRVWGAQTRSPSRSHGVLVNQPSESVASADSTGPLRSRKP